jgi:TrmH family RNA methyltransferase
MQKITSSKNPLIKEIKSLRNRKHREEKRLFFIEGEKLVKEAIHEKMELVRIFVSGKYIKDSSLDYLKSDNIIVLNEKLFKEISDTETPQGIIAILKQKTNTFNDVFNKNNCIVILDTIQDPGNMGTIIRTVDAAGFSGVLASRGCVYVYSPKVTRSTMGSIFRVPICTGVNIVECIKDLKARDIKIYASHLNGESNIYDVDMIADFAIVIGNESKGISQETYANSDVLVKIPMLGNAESLNASVAAGVLMYECVRQRLLKYR